jgi:uncharacterized phage protein (TIGR01671 family)
MKEILFRGKTENGEWFEGSLHKYTIVKPLKTENHYRIQVFEYGYSSENEFDCDYMSGFDEEVIPETVGQYTGLSDKNGKKIFEGDIIACTNYDEELIVEGVVKYGNFNCSCCDGVYGWYIDGGDIRRLADWVMDDSNAEVIGNIHDNPELLEE